MEWSAIITFLRDELPRFAAGFFTGNAEIDRNLQLKIDHTLRVADEMADLAEAERFSEGERLCALAAALEHDRSRFEQFSRFRTFRDSTSFDHGERSAELAAELPELREFGADARRDILFAIRFHNRAALPAPPSENAGKLARAVRDADKLDIVELVLRNLTGIRDRAVTFGLDETPEITPAIAAAMLAGTTPHHTDMVHAVDFLAAKLMWGRDLNFRHSAQEFLRRDYMGRLLRFLPDTPFVREIAARESALLSEKADGRMPNRG